MIVFLSSVAFASPVFDVERGLYDVPFAVEISAGLGGTLYYSLDGAEPNVPYVGPIPVAGTSIVRAVEVAADGTSSEVVTHTYLFVDDILDSAVIDPVTAMDPVLGPILESTLRTLPSVSIVVPDGVDTVERAGSFEWLDPAGEASEVNCGVHIVGNSSLGYEKASIRLNFRAEYGESRYAFDLYGPDATGVRASDEHDALTLRAGNHDTVFWNGARGQLLRNLFMDETQLEMGHVVPHGRFAHLYLNGVYHGVYHVRERFGAAFMASYFGGQEEEYEAINGGTTEDGTGAAWANVLALSSDYEAIREWLEVPNFLDYMVLSYWAGNAADWLTYQNWNAAGPSAAGRGGFVFHSNDSDACLYFDWRVNILDRSGPSMVFPDLLQEGHPDFRVALADAIHRNLEGDGPVTATRARSRYEALASDVFDAIVAEEARWGFGWWERDEEWVSERDYLLDEWLPNRTEAVLRQMKNAGWYPVPAPTVARVGQFVTVTRPPDWEAAELWVTLDGTDPRLSGGEPAPTAMLVDDPYEIAIDLSTSVSARLRDGEDWGALEASTFEVDVDPPIVLNEWNAVADDEMLSEGDLTLGSRYGNGGDWIELVVIEDGLDLRGWRITMEDRLGDAGEVRFTDDPLLASLRAGSIVTIARDLAEDPSYDPDLGDWNVHLQASPSGRFVVGSGFDVTPFDWRMTLRDAVGHVRFGPVGESIEPRAGLGANEVGRLEADPSGAIRPLTEAYSAGDSSTYGAPNTWGDDEVQVFTGLRGIGPVETSQGDDTDELDVPRAGADQAQGALGCGCASTSGAGAWWAGLLVLIATRRRAR